MIDKNELRIDYIYNQQVCKYYQCRCCNNFGYNEEMWKVRRKKINIINSDDETVDDWYYCKKCAPTKEDVLNIIDNDNYPYGVYPIEKSFNIEKILKTLQVNFPLLATEKNNFSSQENLKRRYEQTLECIVKAEKTSLFGKYKCNSCNKLYDTYNNDLWVIETFCWDNKFRNRCYCFECAPTKEDVLYKYYTNEEIWGIYPIDNDTKLKNPDIKSMIIEKIEGANNQKIEVFSCDCKEPCEYKRRVYRKDER